MFFKIYFFCSLLTCLSCAALKHRFARIKPCLACKLSIDVKTCICILHPQFTFNSLLRITGGLHQTKCQFQDTEMCGCSCATTQTTAHAHAHTRKVVGGKGNPLCVFVSFSYECVSDIKAIGSAASGPSSGFSFLFTNITGLIIY